MRILSSFILFALLTTNAFAGYVAPPYETAIGGTGTGTQTAGMACFTDGSSHLVSSGPTTATELGYLSGVTSSVQTQFSALSDSIGSSIGLIGWRPWVTLEDDTATTLPTGTSYTADGQPVQNGDRILFTALSAGGNEVYVAGGVGTSLTWTVALDGQSGSGTPAPGDVLTILDGQTNAEKILIYSGAAWTPDGGTSSGANTTLSNLGTTAINSNLNPATNGGVSIGTASLGFGVMFSEQFATHDGVGNQSSALQQGNSPNGGHENTVANLSSVYDPANSTAFGSFGVYTADDATNATGNLYLETGNASSGTTNTGNVLIQTGSVTNATGGQSSGNIQLYTGVVSGTGSNTEGEVVVSANDLNMSSGSIISVNNVVSAGGLEILDSTGQPAMNVEAHQLFDASGVKSVDFNTTRGLYDPAGTIQMGWGNVGNIQMYVPLQMNSQQINNVLDPTSAQDVVTLAYLSAHGGSSTFSVVDGGDAAYTIQATDSHVRTTTTLTAIRTWTLPACTGSNIGERHSIKVTPAQTFAVSVAAAGSDLIDGLATQTVAPGNALKVICAAFSTVGTWDLD